MTLIAAISLIWNLMTAALLPVVVTEPKPFLESLREGVRATWNRKGRFWLPVVVQMLLLGWICFISISSTSVLTSGRSPSISEIVREWHRPA